jgi:hypothetical protein
MAWGAGGGLASFEHMEATVFSNNGFMFEPGVDVHRVMTITIWPDAVVL